MFVSTKSCLCSNMQTFPIDVASPSLALADLWYSTKFQSDLELMDLVIRVLQAGG